MKKHSDHFFENISAMIQASFGLLLALHFPQRRLDEDMEHSFTTRSALVNIRRRALLFRSDFVNLWRHARLKVFDTLKYVIHLHFNRLYPTCLIFGERFCPTFFIIPRLTPIYSNKKMPLPSFKGCFDVSSLSLLRGEKDLSVDVTK